MTGIESKVQSSQFQIALDNTLLAIFVKGRAAAGASPPESFQLFVNSYVPFWNEVDPGYDTVSFEMIWTTKNHLLTTGLRKRMNDIVRSLNSQIKRSVDRLAVEGVFYVDGYQDSYVTHQFCEPGTDLWSPISPDTWFWHVKRLAYSRMS